MIKRQVKTFLIVGLTTVLVDFVTYSFFVYTNLLPIAPAKIMGFITGTVFAYFANKRWTFSDQKKMRHSLWSFALLYAATLWANVTINSILVSALKGFPLHIQIAFGFATFVSATLNFIGMKLFVFKNA